MKTLAAVFHSLAISQVMLNFARRHGIDSETCLRGIEIDEAQFHNADALITAEQEMRLIENLRQALPNVPALGFTLGLQYNVSTFGTWGFTLRTSRNFREAIEKALRYIPLSTAYCSFSTAVEGEKFVIIADERHIPANLRTFLLERDLGTAINLAQELNLAEQPVERLEFTGPPPSYAEEMATLAGIPIHYHASRNAIIGALKDLQKPLPTFDEHLARTMEDQCQQLLERRQIGGVAGRVRQCLLGDLGLLASLEDVAKHLHVSARSLRRKLDGEGCSFRSILEESRRGLAEQLLTTTTMKLDELAMHLGYAETASFTRAFRRWHGMSPGKFRAAQGRGRNTT